MRKTTRIAAALAAVALAAACGTTENKGGSSGSGSDGVTDTSIKVGGVLVKTSATGYSTGGAELGAKARFERANAEGGVNGRKIDFVGAEDDNMDPAKGTTVATKLVQKDKVFALVPVSSPQFGGAAFLEQQNVPWFGWATGTQWCGTKTGFGYNGCLAPKPGAGTQTWWGNQVAAQIGGADGKSAFIQGTDSSASKYGVGTIGQSFSAAGFKLAGTSAAIPATAPPQDWLPYVNKIMKANDGKAPDVVVSIMAGAKLNAGLFGALRKAGYKGAISDATSYDPSVLADPAIKAGLEGVLTAPQFEPFESDAKEVVQMKADIQKVDPSAKLTQHVAIGYWTADIFLKVAEKAGKDLTRTSFLTAASTFTYENPGFGKIDYPKDKTEPNGCGALVQLKDGQFVVAQHLKCTDNVALKQ
ncbi:ABC transporter substrate-binding protein [Actinocorallia longicatena]|uniref:ABC transporter substrate-binding protein n=1 Tax=Actinocorallia longicatena TaxID=111803 RepID=A0ABP6PYR8_9ACTN